MTSASVGTFSLGNAISLSFGTSSSFMGVFSLEGVTTVNFNYAYRGAIAYKSDGTILTLTNGTTTNVADYDLLIVCTVNTQGRSNTGSILLA